MRKHACKILLSAFFFGATVSSVSAEEHVVKMLNRGPDGAIMVFEPALVEARVGDTVRFVPTDPSHNAETIRGMTPDGAKGFKGKINEEIVFTAEQDGVYGVKCLPHYGLGMVGLVVVGEPVNLNAAKGVRQIGRAKAKFAELFSKVEAK